MSGKGFRRLGVWGSEVQGSRFEVFQGLGWSVEGFRIKEVKGLRV